MEYLFDDPFDIFPISYFSQIRNKLDLSKLINLDAIIQDNNLKIKHVSKEQKIHFTADNQLIDLDDDREIPDFFIFDFSGESRNVDLNFKYKDTKYKNLGFVANINNQTKILLMNSIIYPNIYLVKTENVLKFNPKPSNLGYNFMSNYVFVSYLQRSIYYRDGLYDSKSVRKIDCVYPQTEIDN